MKNLNQNPADRQQKKSARRDKTESDWRSHLPADYADAIIYPLYIRCHSEYEINAIRCIGYDGDDQPCHVAHRVELTRVASDDDEEFYEVVSYQEELAAWRLRDDRWLIFRITATEQCAPPRGFYTLSPDMPR